jgi:hypothetical protein
VSYLDNSTAALTSGGVSGTRAIGGPRQGEAIEEVSNFNASVRASRECARGVACSPSRNDDVRVIGTQSDGLSGELYRSGGGA